MIDILLSSLTQLKQEVGSELTDYNNFINLVPRYNSKLLSLVDQDRQKLEMINNELNNIKIEQANMFSTTSYLNRISSILYECKNNINIYRKLLD